MKIISKLVDKSLRCMKNKDYYQAFKYLKYIQVMLNLVKVDFNNEPTLARLKIELHFLTHDYEYIVDNIGKHLEIIDKNGLKEWTEADKNYLKVYSAMFAYFSHFLLGNREEAEELYYYMCELDMRDASEDVIFNRPPYRKKDLEKLFKEEPYYRENFSENKLNYLLRMVAKFWEDEE